MTWRELLLPPSLTSLWPEPPLDELEAHMMWLNLKNKLERNRQNARRDLVISATLLAAIIVNAGRVFVTVWVFNADPHIWIGNALLIPVFANAIRAIWNFYRLGRKWKREEQVAKSMGPTSMN